MDPATGSAKKFPDCANETLLLIRTNFSRFNRQELIHLAYEYIFFYEYKKEQNQWVKKANAMQELQCTDIIMNFFENEKESDIREYIFDLLFDDIHQGSTKFILQSLLSYAISLEASKTIECINKWIIINIGNEIIQNIFEQLIRDHFLFMNREKQPAHYLINLCNISPLFCSLFMAVVFDMLRNDSLKNHDQCLDKLFNLFEIWIEKNKMLPLLAFQTNLSHASSNMFNPLPGLIYLSVIYPIKSCLECINIHTNLSIQNLNQFSLCEAKAKSLDDLVSKSTLIYVRLIKEILNVIRLSSQFRPGIYKLLNLKQLEFICKKLEESNISINKLKLMNGTLCFHNFKTLIKVRDDCLDRLAQLIEVCWRNDFITCDKSEAKLLFANILSDTSSTLLSNVLDS